MLTAADLEVNVLEFRQRSFQFERLAEIAGEPYAVFRRTETESERRLRPRLLHLILVSPLAWVQLDAEADVLRLGRAPSAPEATPVEVAAEPTEFEADGRRWRRSPLGESGFLYAPTDLGAALLTPEGRAALGLD